MGDNFDHFMNRVFEAPDLLQIREFNEELKAYEDAIINMDEGFNNPFLSEMGSPSTDISQTFLRIPMGNRKRMSTAGPAPSAASTPWAATPKRRSSIGTALAGKRGTITGLPAADPGLSAATGGMFFFGDFSTALRSGPGGNAVATIADELDFAESMEDSPVNSKASSIFAIDPIRSPAQTASTATESLNGSRKAFMFDDIMIEVPADQFRGEPQTSDLLGKPVTTEAAPNIFNQSKAALNNSVSDASRNDEYQSDTKLGLRRFVFRPIYEYGSLLRDIKFEVVHSHSNRVQRAVFVSKIEDMFISATSEPTCSLWPTYYKSPAPLTTFAGHTDAIMYITVSPNLALVATCGADGFLNIYDLTTFRCVSSFAHPSPLTCAAFSFNSRYIVTGCMDNICRLWNSRKAEHNTAMSVFNGHKNPITSLAFQPKGDIAASGCRSGTVLLWLPATGKLSKIAAKGHHSRSILSLSFNKSGKVLISVDTRNVALIDASTGSVLYSLSSENIGTRQLFPTAPTEKRSWFTFATFAPQHVFPDYFLIFTNTGMVAVHEFRFNDTSADDQASAKNATARGPKERQGKGKVQSQKNLSTNPAPKSSLVDFSPEIWSAKLPAGVCCATCGVHHKIIVGDIVGNVIVISLEPIAPQTFPPPRILQRLRINASVAAF